MGRIYEPKIIQVFREGYTRPQLLNDLLAGVLVGLVALPIAIAFAVASGVSPVYGIYTATIGGFIAAILGGSRVQIAGPTGAFVVVIAETISQLGMQGFLTALFLAGVILVLLGALKIGRFLKYIPYSVSVGFTTGLALIIFTGQVKEFLGLERQPLHRTFLQYWFTYDKYLSEINWYAVAVGVLTILVTVVTPKTPLIKKMPPFLVSLVFATLMTAEFDLPIETVFSRFGELPSELLIPSVPPFSLKLIELALPAALLIAILAGIETLLSAVVADGMIGGRHRPNIELIAVGFGNIASACFGGVPLSGGMARTTANIRSGGRTPVAAIVHSIVIAIVVFLFGSYVAKIPLAALAGILFVIAYYMANFTACIRIARAGQGEGVVLIVTLLVTILVGLLQAIEVGVVLSALFFIRKMEQDFTIQQFEGGASPLQSPDVLPAGVVSFSIEGPLFFGATEKFSQTLLRSGNIPKVLILRLGKMRVIDGTGLRLLDDLVRKLSGAGARIIFSEMRSTVSESVVRWFAQHEQSKVTIATTFEEAVAKA
jgi:SulP family sulfate permease